MLEVFHLWCAQRRAASWPILWSSFSCLTENFGAACRYGRGGLSSVLLLQGFEGNAQKFSGLFWVHNPKNLCQNGIGSCVENPQVMKTYWINWFGLAFGGVSSKPEFHARDCDVEGTKGTRITMVFSMSGWGSAGGMISLITLATLTLQWLKLGDK